jgi:hypothetical protein
VGRMQAVYSSVRPANVCSNRPVVSDCVMIVVSLPCIRKQALLMSSAFGSSHRCEQLFSLMKSFKSRTRQTDKHLEGCMRIVAAEIKPVVERLTN